MSGSVTLKRGQRTEGLRVGDRAGRATVLQSWVGSRMAAVEWGNCWFEGMGEFRIRNVELGIGMRVLGSWFLVLESCVLSLESCVLCLVS